MAAEKPIWGEPSAPTAGRRLAACFEHVSKQYRKRYTLDDVSLSVREGESLAITGVNGAGKTTLLKCLLDFVRPEQGEIRIFGQDSRQPAARANLAFVPERFSPPSHLTGHEVLQWLAGLQGSAWSRSASQAIFEAFDIPHGALDRAVRHFSKGMAQKLALGAALEAGKALLVLDEPMSGLDPLARASVAAKLQQARARGTSLLFTSHSLADVAALCDRLAIVHDGRLRFVGTPAELTAISGERDLERAFLTCIQSEQPAASEIP